jgi:thymidylate synthase
MQVGELVYSVGDAHIYHNHFDQVKEQLSREEYPLPTLMIDDEFDLNDRLNNGFKLEDASYFKLFEYQSHDAIKAPMAV